MGLIAAACAPVGSEISNPADVPFFTATINADGGATKTLLAGEDESGRRQVLWRAGDVVTVGGASYRVHSGAGTATAVLAGHGAVKDPDGKYRAYYAVDVSGSTLSLPSVQTYLKPTAEEDNLVVASSLPMFAESSGTELGFKNLCSVLNFRLTGSSTNKVTSVVVTSVSNKLSGPFSVNWNNGSPIVRMSEDASNTVRLDCGSGVILDPNVETEFCIAIPAGHYDQNDLTVEVLGGEKVLATFTNSAAAGAQLDGSVIYKIEKTQSLSLTVRTDANHLTLELFQPALSSKLKIDWEMAAAKCTMPACILPASVIPIPRLTVIMR